MCTSKYRLKSLDSVPRVAFSKLGHFLHIANTAAFYYCTYACLWLGWSLEQNTESNNQLELAKMCRRLMRRGRERGRYQIRAKIWTIFG